LKNKLKEIWEELKSVLSGSTIDILLPPIVFGIVNALFGLTAAVGAAMGLGLLLGVLRLVRKQPWQYALAGLLAVGLAAGLALFTRNAASYFIPAIISSAVLLLIGLVSILFGKPLAAWASHLTRGWPLAWFWRKDIRPAYTEVTWMWTVFFALRLVLQIFLFQQGAASRLAWANTLLGWPVTVLVLVISYIYGIWCLRKLGGPGVEEFEAGKEPPWKGQTRGF
jgi:xanthosine utilization system XapX-like protein